MSKMKRRLSLIRRPENPFTTSNQATTRGWRLFSTKGGVSGWKTASMLRLSHENASIYSEIYVFRFNKILNESLLDSRLGQNGWCQCRSNDGRNRPSCTGEHRFPKSCFCCCVEAAAKDTVYGLNYREKLGDRLCVCANDQFCRRALDLEVRNLSTFWKTVV